ncbi:MAG: ferrous iron transport protein B [Anaerolineaceae bacterium]|nr:ferrous iron transport protein B [Anaerolineaceae bacterium]
MKIALIGQPNCGKSTLFNQVAGYRAETGNFSGTTVTFTETKVRVLGEVVQLVDLPGTYTLKGTNPAEREVFNYLLNNTVDVIIGVVDATRLAFGLELIIELIELGKPLVLALNMIDEAKRLGIEIDGNQLSKELGIPVLPLIASRGRGVKQVFVSALHEAKSNSIPQRLKFNPEIESYINALSNQSVFEFEQLPEEAEIIKILEADEYYQVTVIEKTPQLKKWLKQARKEYEKHYHQALEWDVSAQRHIHSENLLKIVVTEGKRTDTIRDHLDKFLLHPVYGYFFMAIILYIFFQFVYSVGSQLEGPVIAFFDWIEIWVTGQVKTGSLPAELLSGLVQGIAGGAGIVLPYLTPFLIGLGFLEDVGYLPRIAFLMDSLMHHLGLHGKAIVPLILGYGCNVPAVMSTRIMEEPRDRFITIALSTLVPCSACLAVVFGLVAYYLGPGLALGIYIYNLLFIGIVAGLLAKLAPEDSPGLILEIPPYRVPTIKSIFNRAWFQIKEFIFIAWPVLIGGSLTLALFNYFKLSKLLNAIASPLTWLLGLPKEVGLPLIFGILRKELTLIMLRQAVNTPDLGNALTQVQMVTFAVFVIFYIPCLATLVVIRKELGTKLALSIAGMTVVVATIAALLARLLSVLFL